jgi:hypothetical protein
MDAALDSPELACAAASLIAAALLVAAEPLVAAAPDCEDVLALAAAVVCAAELNLAEAAVVAAGSRCARRNRCACGVCWVAAAPSTALTSDVAFTTAAPSAARFASTGAGETAGVVFASLIADAMDVGTAWAEIAGAVSLAAAEAKALGSVDVDVDVDIAPVAPAALPAGALTG